MNAARKDAWRQVRERGRATFVLKSIGMCALSCAIGIGLIEVVCIAFGHADSIWWAVRLWALAALSLGVVFGIREWNQNEKEYGESGTERENR